MNFDLQRSIVNITEKELSDLHADLWVNMNCILLTYLCIELYVREIYLFIDVCRSCLLPASPSRETMKRLVETRQTPDQKRSCT